VFAKKNEKPHHSSLGGVFSPLGHRRSPPVAVPTFFGAEELFAGQPVWIRDSRSGWPPVRPSPIPRRISAAGRFPIAHRSAAGPMRKPYWCSTTRKFTPTQRRFACFVRTICASSRYHHHHTAHTACSQSMLPGRSLSRIASRH
jgi:hypothetical protein